MNNEEIVKVEIEIPKETYEHICNNSEDSNDEFIVCKVIREGGKVK